MIYDYMTKEERAVRADDIIKYFKDNNRTSSHDLSTAVLKYGDSFNCTLSQAKDEIYDALDRANKPVTHIVDDETSPDDDEPEKHLAPKRYGLVIQYSEKSNIVPLTDKSVARAVAAALTAVLEDEPVKYVLVEIHEEIEP